MFEKEAEERARKIEENQTLGVYDNYEDAARDIGWNEGEVAGYEEGFKDGAEFGYNKANEWHNLQENPTDLPLNTDPVLCLGSTGFIVCKYISGSWVDNQTIKLVPKYIDIYKWCEIEDTEE